MTATTMTMIRLGSASSSCFFISLSPRFSFLSVCLQTFFATKFQGPLKKRFYPCPFSKICTSLLFLPFWFYVSSSVDPNPNRQTSTLTTTNKNKFLCVCLLLRSQITASFFHKFQFNNPTYLILLLLQQPPTSQGLRAQIIPAHPVQLVSAPYRPLRSSSSVLAILFLSKLLLSFRFFLVSII